MAPRSSRNDFLQNLANLLYDPRPPVFIVTNALAYGSNEFRFYLDLNRNGRYDPNGLQPLIVRDPAGASGLLRPRTAILFRICGLRRLAS